jgi:uncharacterized protein (DUF1499 family)
MVRRRQRLIFWLPGLILLLPILGLIALRILSPLPVNLGVQGGHLSDCPQTPNCVSSRAQDQQHRIDPFSIQGTQEEIIAHLKTASATIPRLEIVAEDGAYLRLQATSLLFRFVDDVEFLIDDETGLVQVRSASRVGYSDMGTNRSRLENIREALAESP